jgi:hypothetical protein
MKCQVQWVCNDPHCHTDEHKHVDEGIMGRATPDDNEAIGYAISFSGDEFEPFPICREHWYRMPLTGWGFRKIEEVPTPAELDKWVAEVRTVVGEIRRRFPGMGKRMIESAEILSELRPAGPRKYDYYSFIRAGMFHGVEKDGYIHT